MNNLSKEKKQQIAFVAMITVVVVAGIWFGLISNQRKGLEEAARKTAAAREKVENAQKLIKQSEQIQEQLEEAKSQVASRESTMASGDLYQWFLSRMIAVTTDRPVNFTASPPNLVDAQLLPKFPYRAASYALKLNGHFHDVGRLIADMENQFPYARMQNVVIVPAAGPQPGQTEQTETAASSGERLSYSLEFVTLYHTNQAITIK